MSLKHLISNFVPILKPTDTGEEALVIMDDNNLNQLPLVIDNDYLALVQENDINDWLTPEHPLSAADFLKFKPIAQLSAHPFEALRIFHQLDLSVLPVLDDEQKYIGAITKDTLLAFIAESSGMDNPGGILVIEVLPKNYTLYDVARICESEDALITHSILYTNAQGNMELTLKLNRMMLDGVVASLERHKYVVKEVYGKHRDDDDLEDNYNMLMTYLNI